MAYFPLFIELKDEHCLVIGDGKVAQRKANVLRQYEAFVDIRGKGEWELCDCLDAAIVIAATDDRQWNHLIGVYCQEHGIPVNVADSKEDSTFLFPAVVKEGPVSVGISTSGSSPMLAADLRREIEGIIDEDISNLAIYMDQVRDMIKKSSKEPAKRRAMLMEAYQSAKAGKKIYDYISEE